MSTYQLQLSEKLDFLTVVDYSQKYTKWKNISLSVQEVDDDDKVITGKELQDLTTIGQFLKSSTGKFFSLLDVAQLLWKLTEYKPKKEGQAKRIVLNVLS